MNILYFDTETTGLPDRKQPLDHPDQPHITQLGFILEVNGNDALVVDTLIKPENWPLRKDKYGKVYDPPRLIDPYASEITGITEEMCEKDGIPIADAVEMFVIAAENADLLVCHNTVFDKQLLGIEYLRLSPGRAAKDVLCGRPDICTMKVSTPICRIGKKDGRTGYKWPKLSEAILFFFNEELENAHSAIVDIKATRRLYHKLGELGYLNDEYAKLGLAA